MAKKNRWTANGQDATEPFFVVTMDNGKSSQALESRVDVVQWLEENWASDDSPQANKVSQITVKRKRRKSVLLKLAELNSEVTILEKRLEFLKEQKQTLETTEAAGKAAM